MKFAAVVAVVVLGMAAAWIWTRGVHAPPATPGGSFTDIAPPRDPVPMPDAAVSVPAEVPTDHASSNTGGIRFPDGDVVEIRWREPEVLSFELSGNATTDYIPLRLAAEAGDGLAAWTLFLNLSSCHVSFRDEDDLAAAIDDLRTHGSVKFPNVDAEVPVDDADLIDPLIEDLNRQYESCRGISDRQIGESDRLLKFAAESGIANAAMTFGAQLDDPLQARQWYELAWRSGHAHALPLLAESYRAGYEDGIDPQDKLRRYAAIYAFVRLNELAYGGPSGPVYLDEAKRELLPHEIDEALDIAREMLRANPNCCERL